MTRTPGGSPPDPETGRGAPLACADPRHQEDWALVQRCVAGDREAWALLLRTHEATLRYAILHTLRSGSLLATPDAVADLLSDLCLDLVRRDCRRLRGYAGRCRLSSWLKVVANHYTIDQLRRHRPTRSLHEDSPSGRALRASLVDPSPGPEALLREARRLEALRQLCRQLPDEDRLFVDLFYLEEQSFEAIAEAMQTTVGAVYARKNRVRRKLLRLAEEAGLLDEGEKKG